MNIDGYQILGIIYESQSSLVYRARRDADDKPVMLKMLKGDYPSAEDISRYNHEFRMTNGRDLPGIIKVLELIRHHHRPVLVYEDFGAIDLRRLIRERTHTLSELLEISIKIARVLEGVHAARIVHRDIKPANIVINPDTGRLALIDFGSALEIKSADQRERSLPLVGTLSYISPEQTGRLNRPVDWRSDLYSFGATLYEIMTGRLPFLAEDPLELIHAHIARRAASPHDVNPEIPAGLSQLIMKLLAKNLEDRYQSAKGVRADLAQCLEMLKETGDIPPFVLGSRDVSDRFRIPQKLFGRGDELRVLVNGYKNALKGAKSMILVSGPTGIGKSALTWELKQIVARQSGYFIRGGYGRDTERIPYIGIASALKDWTRQVLSEGSDKISRWRKRFEAAVGPNGALLLDFVPEMERIVGPQPPVMALESAAAQSRMKMTWLNLMRVVCGPEHPIVLFLDFIHMADSESLELIQQLMKDPEMEFLLLIGAYRNDELGSGRPWDSVLEVWRNNGFPIDRIEMGPFSDSDIALLAADTFGGGREAVEPLARLIGEKTAGNPFFVIEFIQNLYQEGLVEYDYQKNAWTWDLDRIAGLGISDNVGELLAAKIRRMNPDTIRVIKLAATLGVRFDSEELAVIAETSVAETTSLLQDALDFGLVTPTPTTLTEGKNGGQGDENVREYTFSHERIHEAAYSLIPTSEIPARHYQNGRLLLENLSEKETESRLTEVVEQLNRGLEYITDTKEKYELARLNLRACRMAKTTAAWSKALVLAGTAMALLPDNSWNNEFKLTLDIHLENMELFYLNAEYPAVDALAEKTLGRVTRLMDRVRVYEIYIDSYIAQNRWPEAGRMALPVLRELGVKLPRNPGKLRTLLAVMSTNIALGFRTVGCLVDSPEMNDPEKIATLRFMTHVSVALGAVHPRISAHMSAAMVKMSIRYGQSIYSVLGYTNFGLMLCSVGFPGRGSHFAKLGLDLMERLNLKELRPQVLFTYYLFTSHWREHLRESLEPLREAHHQGMQTGDVTFTVYSIVYYCVHSFLLGQPLTEVDELFEVHSRTIRRLQVEAGYSFMNLYRQVIFNLINDVDDPSLLAGEFYDEDKMLAIDDGSDNRGRDLGLAITKALLGVIFNLPRRGLEFSDRFRTTVESMTSNSGAPIYYCLDSLLRLSLWEISSEPDRQALLKRVAQNQKRIRLQVKFAPMNYRHRYLLVKAEVERIKGKHNKAAEHYDQAIRLARDNEYPIDEAIANEKAGLFYHARGKTAIAKAYLLEARYGYLRWGAEAKVRRMDEQFPDLLPTPVGRVGVTETQSTATSTSDPGESLDLASMMKATQAMSGEIVLAKLLDRLLHIIMENAGADRGVLIMEREGRWIVEASASASSEALEISNGTTVEESDKVSSAIVTYVARTEQAVILDSAAKEGKFVHDPYVQRTNAQSVLCMPLTNKGKMTAILYLENNLTDGVFTPERRTVLNLLSNQAAISLENARLYEKLENYTHWLEEIIAALDVAKEVQQSLLPQRAPKVPGIDIVGKSLYCDQTGGDYYDFIKLGDDSSLALVIGDVSGHGISSALLMASVRAYLHARAVRPGSPAETITAVNRLVAADTEETGQFMTMFYLTLQPETRALTWVRAGHEPAWIYCPFTDEFSELDGQGIALGVDEEWEYEEVSGRIQPGQILILTTDGVWEAHNKDGEMYGRERFKNVIRTNAHLGAEAMRKAVMQSLAEFQGDATREDDVTLVIVKCEQKKKTHDK